MERRTLAIGERMSEALSRRWKRLPIGWRVALRILGNILLYASLPVWFCPCLVLVIVGCVYEKVDEMIDEEKRKSE